MELRSVIGRMVDKFDIALPNPETFDDKSFFAEIKDHFTAGVPQCEIRFVARDDCVYGA